ncbi:claret [Anaeramoeba flamelloides]|uniref:Claret n=1 Tax=Anaeramoeba flamelloides TaxID=1746091 RepID=A0ABQ8YX32_9EUKA|nr:claret [Anaeramoeba flamelloides]
MNTSPIYISCDPAAFNYLWSQKDKSTLPRWTPVTKLKNIKKVKKIVVLGCFSVQAKKCLVWVSQNRLELYHSNFSMKEFVLENETIVDIQAGFKSFLILTELGNVYSLASAVTCTHCEIPISDTQPSTWEIIRSVPYFNKEENNRKVESIIMTSYSNFFLCDDGKLYGNGRNKGKLGDGTNNESQNLPKLITENVTRVFGGINAWHYFFTKTSDELFVVGDNSYGNLGIGNSSSQNAPKKIDYWKSSSILDIYCFYESTVLITQEGVAYGCGSSSTNGHTNRHNTFSPIHELKNKKIVKVTGGRKMAVAITSENELYGWGFENNKFPTDRKENEQINNRLPTKINLPKFYQENLIDFEISCGSKAVIIYPKTHNVLLEDFMNLLDSKKFCDSKLVLSSNENNEIHIHKLIVEFRTGLKIESLQKIINKNNLTQKEIEDLLKWVYYNETSDPKKLLQLFDSFNLSSSLIKNSLENDLLKLFNDEDSKDFNILVKIDDDEDGDENNELEDEEGYEEIPVHKLILIARSGLFREMFRNLNEKEKDIGQIKDYSGKSIESLEILIKYFYTNSLKLTADDDPELVVEELEDVIEYYQLNKNSNLQNELNVIKNQFNLN